MEFYSLQRIYVLVFYLFIYSDGGHVDSVIHPFDLLPQSIFDFQMFKIKQHISTNGEGHRVCITDGEIILCHIDVSRERQSSPESNPNFPTASLIGQSRVSVIESFQRSSRC